MMNNVVNIPNVKKSDFFKLWMTILKPFTKASDREVDVLSEMLRIRFEMKKDGIDDSALMDYFKDKYTRVKIREKLNISEAHFSQLLSSLRSKKVIIGNDINPKLIPHIDERSEEFTFMYYIDFAKE